MKRFIFFLDKFFFDTGIIGVDGRVIIILISSENLRCRSGEVTSQRHTFCADAEGSRIVWDGIVRSERTCSGVDDGIEVTRPVPMAVSVFAIQPSNKVSIDKVEP